jgi:cation diffusion facilitator family transporter
MAENKSKKVVYVAIFSNLAIACCKFGAASISGSPAMLAEAVHSTVDTGNELLLLFGMHRSKRPPDRLHPFGHGKSLYFYSLLVAVYIFAAGGGFTIYRGIQQIRAPQLETSHGLNYVVLAIAAALDLYSWRISYIELKRQKSPDESVLEEIVGSKDPTVFTVFLEDSVGVVGTAIAFLGIFLGQVFHNPYMDPAASILIGLLLAAVAVFMGRETGALLVGERTTRARIQKMREVIEADEAVELVGELHTMQLGPQEALLIVEVKFRGDLKVSELEAVIQRITRAVRRQEPTMVSMSIQPTKLSEKNGLGAKDARRRVA